MDGDKLKKLEEKLYNETPLFGDRIRKQALKELMEARDVPSIEILTKALIFYHKSSFGNKIFTALKQIKLQEVDLINAVCRIWSEQRDPVLAKLLRAKGWVASRPTSLRVLTAMNLNWQGVIEDKGTKIVAPLLSYFQDEQAEIINTAKQWSALLKTPQLQTEVCRLATEENNQTALEVATTYGYTPDTPEQSALFFYFTQQWDKYQNVDSDSRLLEEIYYNSSSQLQKRIDEHGQALKRLEWVWMRLGGKEGRRVKQISSADWEQLFQVVFQGQHWEVAWTLIPYTSLVGAEKIVKKLSTKRLTIKNPQLKAKLTELNQLWKNPALKTPPQGTLVRLLHRLQAHQQKIKDLVITPDSQILISAGGKEIILWNLNEGTQKQVLKSHFKNITHLALNSSGSILASGSNDKTISLWRLPEGHMIANLSANNASVWSLAMTDDVKTIASASYREIRLWKYPPGSLSQVLEGHTREVEKVLISHNEQLLISAGGSNDNSIRVWSLPEGEEKYILTGHQDGIRDLVLNGDDSILASAGKDGVIKLWSLSDGQEIATLAGHQGKIWCLGISADGKTIVSGSDDRCVKIWSVATGKLEKTLSDHQSAIVCLEISSNGQLLATGSQDGIVKIWNLASGELLTSLEQHQGAISKLKFSANGEVLVTGSEDRTIQIWRWDLSRLTHVPIVNLSEEDEQWLKNSLANEQITSPEKAWLDLFVNLLNFRSNLELKSQIEN